MSERSGAEQEIFFGVGAERSGADIFFGIGAERSGAVIFFWCWSGAERSSNFFWELERSGAELQYFLVVWSGAERSQNQTCITDTHTHTRNSVDYVMMIQPETSKMNF